MLSKDLDKLRLKCKLNGTLVIKLELKCQASHFPNI